MSSSNAFGGADLTRWLVRHGMTDAYAKWRRSTPERRPIMAFTAIAGEADLLMRIDQDHAVKMTAAAEAMLTRIAALPAVDAATAAAAQAVWARISDWYIATGRRIPRRPGQAHNPAAVARADELMMRFPQFSPSFANGLFDSARQAGGLLKLEEPLDKVCALVASSLGARSARGQIDGAGFNRSAVMDVISNVQEWSRQTGRNPFLVDAYKGGGELVDRVSAMAIDASTCVDLAAALPNGIARPGFAMWGEAEEFNAYALLKLRNSPWESMRGDQAIVIASAAARFATRLRDDPTLPVPKLPLEIADKSVEDVYFYARSKTWIVTENRPNASISEEDRASELRRRRISELRKKA